MMCQRMSRALIVVSALFFCLATTLAFGQNVKRMSKEELRDKLGKDNLVVVDVRAGRDWKSSGFKIKGAVRREGEILQWASSYAKETTLVLYCA